jgi:hypothetical protein
MQIPDKRRSDWPMRSLTDMCWPLVYLRASAVDFPAQLTPAKVSRHGYFIPLARDVFDCCDFALISLSANA